jgi:ribonuclease P protein component
MREAFRLNKGALPASSKLLIAYIYSAKEILTFTQIQERLVKTLNRFDHVTQIQERLVKTLNRFDHVEKV